MALRDKNKGFIVDRDENQSIGFKLPVEFEHGGVLTTKTLDAVKEDLLCLVSTEMGERPMQPTLGVKIRQFLFEPFSTEVVDQVQTSVVDSIGFWLPFVKVRNIQVNMSEQLDGDFRSTMDVKIDFSLKQDPGTLESVQITIGE